MNEDGESSDNTTLDCDSSTVGLPSSSSVTLISDTDEAITASQVGVTAVIGSGAGSGSGPRRHLKSMFKQPGDRPIKNVQFPQNEKDLVTYQEPNPHAHWIGVPACTVAEVLENYVKACNKFHTVVQDSIVNQLHEIRNNGDYSATLNLIDLRLDTDVIETLETIFQMVTFRTIYLEKCAAPYATDVVDMLEFYDPVKELVLTDIMEPENKNMWHSIASILSNSKVLSSAAFREMLFEDCPLRILFEKGINRSGHIKKIRFDACGLSRAPTFMLAQHLTKNEYIRELHLCYLDLYSKEAEILVKFLSVTCSLRILDISNNKLGDHGFELLSHGLIDQAERGIGVEVLILFNNKLTKRCVDTINMIISTCPLIHTLNVGMNDLTDIVIHETRTSIENSRTLRAFGLQSTLITCHGITELASTCKKNVSLRHLNLRGNKAIQPESLSDLADVIHNTTLIQIELDEQNRNCGNPQKYTELFNKVRQMTAVNKAKLERERPYENLKWIQEPYLSCESNYVPKSMLRTTRSGYSHRFSVVPVSETKSKSHRFTVVPASGVIRDECEQGPSGVISKKSMNVNAGGDAGSSLIQENNKNSEAELPMETDDINTVITVSDESRNTDNALFDSALNEVIPKCAEEATAMEVEDDQTSVVLRAATSIPAANQICIDNESPIAMDDNMDMLNYILDQENKKSSNGSSVEIIED